VQQTMTRLLDRSFATAEALVWSSIPAIIVPCKL